MQKKLFYFLPRVDGAFLAIGCKDLILPFVSAARLFLLSTGDFSFGKIDLAVGTPNSKQVSHMGEQLVVVCRCCLPLPAYSFMA